MITYKLLHLLEGIIEVHGRGVDRYLQGFEANDENEIG